MSPVQDVTMTWLMEDAIVPNAGVSLAKMTIAGGALSECHKHPNCNEVIHLLSGRIRQRYGETWIDMEPGQTCFIPAGTPHQTENNAETPAIMMIAYSSGTRVYET